MTPLEKRRAIVDEIEKIRAAQDMLCGELGLDDCNPDLPHYAWEEFNKSLGRIETWAVGQLRVMERTIMHDLKHKSRI